MVKRTAFTMIELIFAIVVISIAVISLPMMTQINARGVSENIKQEAIFIASAKLMQVLSYAWDKESVDANINTSFDSARVVDLNIPGSIYGRKDLNNNDDNDTFRIGHVRNDLHRRFFNYYDNNTTHNASDTNISLSIDGHLASEKIGNIIGYGYKSGYDINITDLNVSDTSNVLSIIQAPAGKTNLKLVEVIVEDNSSGTMQTIVRLRSYAANIGEVDYFSRIY